MKNLTIQTDSMAELLVSKSKFIAYSFFVDTTQKANFDLQLLQKQHADATHICFAYVVNGKEKCSDDGEPQGTAGRPILECIKKNHLQNVLIAVVRYFGGIKLGAGGLTRTYGKMASLAINLSGTKQICQCKKVSFCVDISQNKKVAQIQKMQNVVDSQIQYLQDKISICLFVEEDFLSNLFANLNNLFGQNLTFFVDKETFLK